MFKKLALLSLLLIFLLITILSLLPPTSGVEIKNDKIGHFLAYTALSFNALLFGLNQKKRLYFAVLILPYSALIELIQGFIPGRTPSIMDLFANGGGIVLGLLMFSIFGRYFQSKLFSPQDNH